MLGDIDADEVQISAKDADGTPVTAAQIDQWKTGHNVFNYDGGSDLPTWDAATSTLTGNSSASDTAGAAAWFEPDISISSWTFVFTQRAGFPVYQTWFASLARTISGTVTNQPGTAGTCAVDDSTLYLIAPDGRELAKVRPTNGAYSFGQYATQDGYTVRISQPAGYAVVGDDVRPVSTAKADGTADFTLRRVIPQPVFGTVTVGATPVPGVVITLTAEDGGTPKITTTDEHGNYLFDDNTEGRQHTVSVTVPDGYAVTGPSSYTFDVLPGQPVPDRISASPSSHR